MKHGAVGVTLIREFITVYFFLSLPGLLRYFILRAGTINAKKVNAIIYDILYFSLA